MQILNYSCALLQIRTYDKSELCLQLQNFSLNASFASAKMMSESLHDLMMQDDDIGIIQPQRFA